MALVTHTHWVTEASVQERKPLAGAQAAIHTPTLSAVVLWVWVWEGETVGKCIEGEEPVLALSRRGGSPCDEW